MRTLSYCRSISFNASSSVMSIFPLALLLFDDVATNKITLGTETILATVTNGILDFPPDIGRHQLRIEVVGLFNQIAQSHPRLLLGDERSPPRHLAGLHVLFFDNVPHLNLLLEITRLFTPKGAPLIGNKRT